MNSVSRSADVLGLARQVLDHIDGYTLDEIDGAFYWNIVLADLKQQVEATIDPRWILDGPNSEATLEANALWRHASSLIPDLHRVLAGGRPTMRSLWIRLIPGPTQRPGQPNEVVLPGQVRIAVRNAEWDGNTVARAIGDWFGVKERDGSDLLREMARWTRPTKPVAHVELRAELFGPGELVVPIARGMAPDYQNGRSTFADPAILLVSEYPVPPAAVIAAFYDAVVVEQHGWNAQLVGMINGQEKLTAVRTWATALLVSQGNVLTVAKAAVSEALGLSDVSEKQFYALRGQLYARVPELEAYLNPKRIRKG